MKPKSKVLALGCCLALIFFVCAAAMAAEAEPQVGQTLGSVTFHPPITADGAKYLGLAKQESFTLKSIKSPYVLIEQFNTSCPHCMHQAPFLNQVYNMAQQDADLKGKLKFMAAGQANDEMAVKMWKAFHKVPFPVVPDPDSGLGKALNFSPYPVTFIVNQAGKILWVHIGAFDNPDEIVKEIKKVVK
jgi:thiol-disulfide isomerase/thioredoxin